MAIYDFILEVNGVDSETLGLFVSELRGNWDTPTFAYDEVQAPGHDGPIATVDEPELQAKDFVIAGTVDLDTDANFEDAMDVLRFQLSLAALTIIGGNQETRARTGKLTSFKVTPYPEPSAAAVEITVHCQNPIAIETSTTTVSGAAATDLACALGTWKSRPVTTITFSGSASSVTRTYKAYGGATVGTPMVCTHAFVNTDVLVIDDLNRTITLNGTRHDDLLTAGDFIALDPRDGVPSLSHWPTVRTDVGALSIVYSKNWL